MLWGCFAASGTGRLDFVEGRMNSEQYQQILAENVSPSVQKLGLNQSWTFQQDNDPNTHKPVHTFLASGATLQRTDLAWPESRPQSY